MLIVSKMIPSTLNFTGINPLLNFRDQAKVQLFKILHHELYYILTKSLLIFLTTDFSSVFVLLLVKRIFRRTDMEDMASLTFLLIFQ